MCYLLVCTLKVYGTVGDICKTTINNNAQMLSLDFHITFCPFISLCDQSFALRPCLTHTCAKIMLVSGTDRRFDMTKLYGIELICTICPFIIQNINRATEQSFIHIYQQNSSTRNMLHIWTVLVTYLDDWSYISGRFVLRTNTIVMAGIRNDGQLDGSKWHAMIWCDMEGQVVIHYNTKYESSSVIQYDTYTYI